MNTATARKIRELQHQARQEIDPVKANRLILEVADLMSGVVTPEPDSSDPDQPGLFDFPGPAYDPNHDRERLNGQIKRIFDLMIDGRWRTLSEISAITGDGEASVSAQLRHLRKPEFGGYEVPKRRRGDPKTGLWEYRLVRGNGG